MTKLLLEKMQHGDVVGSVYHLALAGDIPGIQSILENESANENLLLEVDDIGRNALFAASMLGRCSVVRELVKYGADINTSTVRGKHEILQFILYHSNKCPPLG